MISKIGISMEQLRELTTEQVRRLTKEVEEIESQAYDKGFQDGIKKERWRARDEKIRKLVDSTR